MYQILHCFGILNGTCGYYRYCISNVSGAFSFGNQHIPIRHDMAMTVIRYILGCDYRNASAVRLCLGGIDSEDSASGRWSTENLAVHHVLQIQVISVYSFSKSLGHGIHTLDLLSNPPITW